MGLGKRDDRPMGVAVRTLQNPNSNDDWLESLAGAVGWRTCCPAMGGSSGMGDGTSNVGLGILNTSKSLRKRRLQGCFAPVARPTAAGAWLHRREHDPADSRCSTSDGLQPAAPHARDAVFGDAGGMVNPFNGEGIATAMESSSIATEVIVQALARDTASQRELALLDYPRIPQRDTYGGYYTLGRYFVKLIR